MSNLVDDVFISQTMHRDIGERREKTEQRFLLKRVHVSSI